MTQHNNPLRQLPLPAIPGVGYNQDKHGGLLIRFHVNDTVKIRDMLVKAATLLTEMAVKTLQDQKLAEQQRFVLPPSKEQVLEQKAKEIAEGAPHPSLSEPITEETFVFPRLPQAPMPPAVSVPTNVSPSATVSVPTNNIAPMSAAPVVVRATEGVEHDDGSFGPPPPSIHLNGGAT